MWWLGTTCMGAPPACWLKWLPSWGLMSPMWTRPTQSEPSPCVGPMLHRRALPQQVIPWLVCSWHSPMPLADLLAPMAPHREWGPT